MNWADLSLTKSTYWVSLSFSDFFVFVSQFIDLPYNGYSYSPEYFSWASIHSSALWILRIKSIFCLRENKSSKTDSS